MALKTDLIPATMPSQDQDGSTLTQIPTSLLSQFLSDSSAAWPVAGDTHLAKKLKMLLRTRLDDRLLYPPKVLILSASTLNQDTHLADFKLQNHDRFSASA
jgi:hypothetical protein